MIILPILAGAVAYSAAQFLWYAPFAFGSYHVRERGITEEDIVNEVATHPESGSRFWFGIVFPAFLSSFALVALKAMTDQLIGTPTGFLVFVAGLGCAVCGPKYIRAFFRDRRIGALVLIQDGALLFSLLMTAFAIILSTAA